METKSVVEKVILFNLLKDNMSFYYAPSSAFLNSISASIFLDLYLNKKIIFEEDSVKIIDDKSSVDYQQNLIDFIKRQKTEDLNTISFNLFKNLDFSMDLFEKVAQDLVDNDMIEIQEKKILVVTKNRLVLKNRELVQQYYEELKDVLFNDGQLLEYVAIAIVLDSFYDLRSIFENVDEETVKQCIDKIHSTVLYHEIELFKKVADEFYNLYIQKNTSMFGI